MEKNDVAKRVFLFFTLIFGAFLAPRAFSPVREGWGTSCQNPCFLESYFHFLGGTGFFLILVGLWEVLGSQNHSRKRFLGGFLAMLCKFQVRVGIDALKGNT